MTNHAGHDHPTTPAARAKCRKATAPNTPGGSAADDARRAFATAVGWDADEYATSFSAEWDLEATMNVDPPGLAVEIIGSHNDNDPEWTVTTADGHTVTAGARVFDYYDGHWGTIGATVSHDGWFDHHREDGPGRGYLNGDRVCVRIPRGNPFYTSHANGNPKD